MSVIRLAHLFKGGLGKRAILLLTYLVAFCLFVIIIAISHNQFCPSARFSKTSGNNLLIDVDNAEREQQLSISQSRMLETDQCDTIHLAIVCGGFNSSRNFYTLLKSILFYRTDIINLHLFVDNISRTILIEIFRTWSVPDLFVNYYNITQYEQEISWIPSQHYSHRYGLMKLVFLSVLSERNYNLTQVILLDTDMLALGNIRYLWNEFESLNHILKGKRPALGMVENQSDWYLGNGQQSSRSVWPAIGRGFNSGLILANLVELLNQNWKKKWRQIAESELTAHLSTSLADQDIFNAVIRSNIHIVCQLSCSFNIQLNDHTKLDEVCPQRNLPKFKLIHWNSPYKFSTRNSKAKFYKNWYLTFQNWDAKLLEQSPCNQQSSVKEDKFESKIVKSNNLTNSNLDNVCREIRPRPEEKLRTFLYFIEFELDSAERDISLVVHLSLDRLQVLDQLAFNWRGPISAAIYLSELETNLLLVSIENSNNLSQRKNIGYHLVFRDQGFNYPINRLRNVALNNAITPYVFLSDIDFLPSTNLYSYLRRTIADMTTNDNHNPLSKRVLVIPAFENLQYKFDFPSSKAELLTQLNLGSVSMFRDQIWPKGHAPTNYAKWRVSTKPYKVDWRPEYEPFIVTSINVPRFDERFVGFGWNKVESIMQLAALNYEFLVLPEAFVIHKFHSASYDIMKHRESFKYRTCIKQLRRMFLTELKQKYPEFFATISATSQSISNDQPNI